MTNLPKWIDKFEKDVARTEPAFIEMMKSQKDPLFIRLAENIKIRDDRILKLITALKIAMEALEYTGRGPRPDDSDHTIAKQALEKIRRMGEE